VARAAAAGLVGAHALGVAAPRGGQAPAASPVKIRRPSPPRNVQVVRLELLLMAHPDPGGALTPRQDLRPPSPLRIQAPFAGLPAVSPLPLLLFVPNPDPTPSLVIGQDPATPLVLWPHPIFFPRPVLMAVFLFLCSFL
jgi:hypothetical protein